MQNGSREASASRKRISNAPPSAHDISISLIGFEKHKARPDLGDVSGFWLRVKVADAQRFVTAFRNSPAAFHEFRIEQRVGKEIRTSTLSAQIIKIEDGPAETSVLIRPDPSVEAALGYRIIWKLSFDSVFSCSIRSLTCWWVSRPFSSRSWKIA
jgi:hypothetical protein